MTQKDKELIAKANQLVCDKWYIADDMIAEAETEEAKRELKHISIKLYRTEEYQGGVL